MSLSNLLLEAQVSKMTSYFSQEYLFMFLPAVVLFFAIFPQKCKRYILLIASYIFVWLISGKLVIYLILSSLFVHYFGLWLDRIGEQRSVAVKAAEREDRKAIKAQFKKKQQRVVILAAVLHFGVLFILKYSPFFLGNINSIIHLFGSSVEIEIPKFAVPIGISFFTMQAMSYIFDVYRGVIKADDNLGRVSLFISFFPQIVEGPICRYNETAEKLWNVKQIEFQNLTFGIQRIIYGMMKKLVVADRLNLPIKAIFADYNEYSGSVIFLGAVAYTIQLYMDFSGAMDAVAGTAQIFGVEMPENFKRPFFSKSISEFWKRWHISLGAWFKDYIFYPVTMSKPMKSLTGKARKKLGNHFGPLIAGSVALLAVWYCNGLWHGAGWNYIFFGMYHFVLILLGSLTEPFVKRFNDKLHINSNSILYRIIQMVRTSLLVVIGEMFFRAENLTDGFGMFRRFVTDFSLLRVDEDLLTNLGIDVYDIAIVAVTLVIVFAVSILNERDVHIRERLQEKNIVLRWLVWYLLILYIIIFGAYGAGYAPVDPMYANF